MFVPACETCYVYGSYIRLILSSFGRKMDAVENERSLRHINNGQVDQMWLCDSSEKKNCIASDILITTFSTKPY